jgi:hypothetical protein
MSDSIVEIGGKKYKAGEWQIWNGGENPIADNSLVQIHMADHNRSKAESTRPCRANELYWKHDFGVANIVCYRVMEEAKPEVVEVVRWVDQTSPSHFGISLFAYHESGSNIVGKVTFNLVDGIPDPKSIKMTLV